MTQPRFAHIPHSFHLGLETEKLDLITKQSNKHKHIEHGLEGVIGTASFEGADPAWQEHVKLDDRLHAPVAHVERGPH